MVETFSDAHRFLSNFYPVTFSWRGTSAASSEHHYMAAKTDDPDQREAILTADSPRQAKRLGRAVSLRPGWDEEEKFQVMRSVLEAKFADPGMRDLLLGTGDALLVEGNTWHDQTWGDCSCPEHRSWPGRNALGRTLMEVRSVLRGDPGDRWPRVALTGHRRGAFSPEQWWWVHDTLGEVMARLHEQHGTEVAISGMALGADTAWAQAALAAQVRLWAYLPFEAQTERWQQSDRRVWRGLRSLAAREVVLAEDFDVRLLHARDYLMIRDADLVVAVHLPHKRTGGTVSAIRKARAEGKPMLRIDPTARTVTFVPARGNILQ